jgi:hypothetical protein
MMQHIHISCILSHQKQLVTQGALVRFTLSQIALASGNCVTQLARQLPNNPSPCIYVRMPEVSSGYCVRETTITHATARCSSQGLSRAHRVVPSTLYDLTAACEGSLPRVMIP